MDYIINILIQFMDRAVLLLACLFTITRLQSFRNVFQRDTYRKKDYFIACTVFSVFAILSTYTGLNVEGSLVNVRTITIVSGGIIFGPVVGIVTGVISGVHRYLIDIGGITSIPCLISSICAGIISGYINRKVKRNYRWIAGIIAGMFSETITMILILLLSRPHSLGYDIVSKIAAPMIIGQISVGFIVLLVQSIENDKEKISAKQAKLALDIANKTLPYFRKINSESLNKICTIIKEDIKADAVSITDTKNILAYSGIGKEYYNIGHEIINAETKEAISSGKIVIKNTGFKEKTSLLKSAIIIPLKEKNEVIGALKIYYRASNNITYTVETLAVGLSQIISTLMEVSKVEEMKEMANKAELKALQTQINPHFLFNALNAIASSIRINPNNARELIINLSSYLRFNLELNSEFIDVKKELKQVKDYIEIEKARFGDKLNIIYDIDDVDIKIPSLTIQPLVENAIVHGILKDNHNGTVKISLKDEGEKVKISIIDSGVGISEEMINNIYTDNVPEKKIGLYNVHSRIKLIYGDGLKIKRLDKGTMIEFYIKKNIRG
ncbi:MAG: sensor histidine kinase [Clostridium sp.]|uniref:sensor histidine kinase n=2 Tax=Clostridiaceae TaxID=31979 RepID=UPI00163D8164|nr:sensor histidine kinase [Clostridium sp.]MDU1277459.1 sensor histidine kinase [Clostridium sp.]MDU1567185.1 sensor histidine kinase [Clostridium sp.]MDU2157828.1 sensor histidine kinase [Clostridium sp.]MDU3524415.1 sensor histidine kinase [Clostridium sp.]MDU3548880.1 sensor histidine kinase [Clostridium sp.]